MRKAVIQAGFPVFLAVMMTTFVGCGSTTPAQDSGGGDVGTNPEADSGTDVGTLSDGAMCRGVGEPAVGGCSVCCSGRCGGTGIVAACVP